MIETLSGILRRTKVLAVIALSGIVLTAFAPLVSAESLEEGPLKRNGWTISVVPYLWMPSIIDGTITLIGQKEDVDVNTLDIVDELLKDFQLAVMVDLEVRKDRIGLFVNPFFIDLRAEENKTILPGTILEVDIKADVTMEMLILGFGVNYRLGPYELGKGTRTGMPRLIVEPYLGGRWSDIDVKLDIMITRSRSFDENVGWADPMFGVRTIWELNPHWNIMIGGDVGGFGVGSDLAWSVTGLVGWRFRITKRVLGTVVWGYRALYQDYERGSGIDKFEYDITMHGPFVGFNFGFGMVKERTEEARKRVSLNSQ